MENRSVGRVLMVGAALAAASLAGGRAIPRSPPVPKFRESRRLKRRVRRRLGRPGKAAKGWSFKGSAWAKRATRRGGNPARTQHPRPVRHHWHPYSQICTMCRITKHRALNLGGTAQRFCQ
jgi:hypothetical protein